MERNSDGSISSISATLLAIRIIARALQEILPVPVAYEYLSALNTPDHDVVQETGRLPAIARLSRGGPASRRTFLGMDSHYLITRSALNLLFYQHAHSQY